MAGRVLLRAAALGLAAAGAGALHAVSRWTPPREISPYVPSVRFMLLESAQGLQAALLGAHPLYGQHLRDVRARAEHDLAATMGGVFRILHPGDRAAVMDAACGAVDKGLVAALQDKELSATERLRLRALRVYLHAKVLLLIKKEARDVANGGAEASPVSW